MRHNQKSKIPKYKLGMIELFAESDTMLQQCIETIRSAIQVAGHKSIKCFFSEETVLNLDTFERKLGKDRADRTVDIVVGCQNSTLVMTELKLRVTNVDEELAHNIMQKFKYSKNLINISPDFHIWPGAVILLNDNKFEQNSRKLYRLCGNCVSCLVLRVRDFYQRVFS